MDSQIVAVYCLCDDMLKTLDHRDDPQCHMTDAEVMTTGCCCPVFWREPGAGSGLSSRRGIIVVVESGDAARGLLVDELIGKQEVVIKNLGETCRKQDLLAGAAILGDGRVGLILDVDTLVRCERNNHQAKTTTDLKR